MRAWCAWCQEEGKPGFLGERPPLDDPGDTHGICDHHRTLLLAALPQRAATGESRQFRRMVLVLDPDAVELYRYLTRSLAGLKGVEVILDRRRRSPHSESPPADPSVPNRRVNRGERHPVGYTIVRLPRAGNG